MTLRLVEDVHWQYLKLSVYVPGEWKGGLITEVDLDLETEFKDVVVYEAGCGDMLEVGLRIVNGYVRASKP